MDEASNDESSERIPTLEALRASEERYRLLFDRSPLPMWVYDQETLGFLAVNQAAIDHYGYTRDQFGAMTTAQVRPEETSRYSRIALGRGRRGPRTPASAATARRAGTPSTWRSPRTS